MSPDRRRLLARRRIADRLDVLADTAELMGDPAGADRMRTQATEHRLAAMTLLDDADP